jgi:hypothetical protein
MFKRIVVSSLVLSVFALIDFSHAQPNGLDPHANLSPAPPKGTPPPFPKPNALKDTEPAHQTGAPETVANNNKPIPAPPPQSAAVVPAPPIPPAITLPPPGPRPASEIKRFTPAVEVWRANAHAPQAPPRRGHYVTEAYVSDNNPVLVRLQFDPAARGTAVFVRPSSAAVLDSNPKNLRINGAGECLVTLHLPDGADRCHVAFHCAGLMTTVSLTRASENRVQASESAGGNR